MTEKPENRPQLKRGDYIGLNVRPEGRGLSRYFNNGMVTGDPVPPQGSIKSADELKRLGLLGVYVDDPVAANKFLGSLKVENWELPKPAL